MDARKEEQYRDALRAARTAILQLQEEKSEPVAIIGMSCLFPGRYPLDALTPEAFHEQLLAGVDSVVRVPAERQALWNLQNKGTDAPQVPVIEQGAFLGGDIHAFDCAFFGIPPSEGRMTDPQHRLLLELSWQALLDAGIAPETTAASQTGVFAGKTGTDFMFDILGTSHLSSDDPYTLTGNMHSALAGRISYFFNWHGPCISYETACSTSLVAVMGAVAALRAKECSMALAGAANLLLGPTPSRWLNAMHALAPDGRSKAFGADADGFGRGEGGGVLVLKRLSDAKRDGNRIHALILGGAVGSDGQSRTFTSPSGIGQRAVITRALANAGVSPEEVGFVETHGTGTPLGDPIEVESLHEVYGKRETPLLIGSVKSNVGHLEAAAGMAALIKTICAVRHGVVHKSLHCERLNPLLDWDTLPIRVARESTDWPVGYARRVAGVSSFAIAGTLAHILVAEAPEALPARESDALSSLALQPVSSRVLLLSASSPVGLDALVGECATRLEKGEAWPQMCDAAANGRPHFSERLALVAADGAEAAAALRVLQGGKTRRNVVRGKSPKTPLPLTFLFSGQGSQQGGMGKDLYAAFPVFREVLDACEAQVAPRLGHSLLEVMFAPDDARLHDTRVTQPAIFSHQVALAELLRQRGIRPGAVLGHSIGEYAAAVTAGIMDRQTGLAIVLQRGELAAGISVKGAMAAVLAGEEATRAVLTPFPEVSIAAINGPDTVTLAGPEKAMSEAVKALRECGIESRPMPVSQAFHCSLIKPALAPFAEFLRGQRFTTSGIPFLSTCTASFLDVQEDWPAYFTRQMCEPVQFFKALNACTPPQIFLEIGAGPTLSAYGRQCHSDGVWLFAQNGEDGQKPLAQALAKLYTLGYAQDWKWLSSWPWKPEAAPGTMFCRERLLPPGVLAWKAPHDTSVSSTPAHAGCAVREPCGAYETAGQKAEMLQLSNPLEELVRLQCETFTAICAMQQALMIENKPE